MSIRFTAFAVLALTAACGGGSSGGSNGGPPPGPTPTPPAAFYLPLAVGNAWTYDCGTGGMKSNTVTQTVQVGGVTTFAYAEQIPSPSGITTQTQLLANDAQGNTTLYGYLINGAVTTVTPTLLIAASPTVGQMFNYPVPDGSTVPRYFRAFDHTNPTQLGTFAVAVYYESNGQRNYGYTLGTGVTEEDQAPYDCTITSYTLH